MGSVQQNVRTIVNPGRNGVPAMPYRSAVSLTLMNVSTGRRRSIVQKACTALKETAFMISQPARMSVRRGMLSARIMVIRAVLKTGIIAGSGRVFPHAQRTKSVMRDNVLKKARMWSSRSVQPK